jgi:GH15 family glucan-1,4-alpha-glucosidase
MVLETVFETADGSVALIDFMPIGQANSSVIRLVQGRRGNVAMRLHLTLRFDYGATVPWVTQLEDKSGLTATAGPSRVVFRAPLPLQGENLATVAEFNVVQGECVPFVLTHVPSHLQTPWALDWRAALQQTEAFWRDWSARCTYSGPWREAVQRSLLTLKARPMRLRAGSSLLLPRRSLSNSEVNATGITATAGCAMPRAPCWR